MASIKIVGYILSGLGLAAILLSSFLTKVAFITKLFGAKAALYTIVGAVALIAVGVVLIMSESSGSTSKVKHAAAEVPIYEGQGKNRRIVGYQKAND